MRRPLREVLQVCRGAGVRPRQRARRVARLAEAVGRAGGERQILGRFQGGQGLFGRSRFGIDPKRLLPGRPGRQRALASQMVPAQVDQEGRRFVFRVRCQLQSPLRESSSALRLCLTARYKRAIVRSGPLLVE